MAFTRAMLKAKGLEKEQVDEIMDAHTEVTDALKAERDQYKEDANKLQSVQKELDELKAKGTDEGYKDKYEKLKKDFDEYKADIKTKEEKSAKESEARKILKELKIPEKYFDKILKYSADEIASIVIDSEGKVSGTEAFKKTVDSDWSDYKTEEGKKGADTATPPSGNGKGKTYASKAEIMAIKDPAERHQAIVDNHEYFNI